MFLFTYFVMPLVLMNHAAFAGEICTPGHFYDRSTHTCTTCTVCPEVTTKLCYIDQDSLCGSYNLITIPADPVLSDNVDSIKDKDVKDVTISQEHRWETLKLVMLCMACSFCVISLVLLVVACRARKFRKDVVYDVTPGYRKFNIGNYTVLDFTEKVSWVTDTKQVDV